MSDHIDFDQLDRHAGAGDASRPEPRQIASAPRPFTPDARVDDTHLMDYVRVLYKRRWTAATAFLVIFVSVAAYTFTSTPLYEARVRVLIETDTPNVVNFKEVIDESQAKADYYQTQYNILESRALARKTIDALKLWDSPHLGVKPAGSVGVIQSVKNAVGQATGWSSEPVPLKEQAAADETTAQSRAIDSFLTQLTVAPIRNSRLVDIVFRSPDPDFATRAANALSKNYIGQNLEYKFSASKEASGWLQEQLAQQRQQVELAESKLQQYREQNGAISMEDRQNIVVQKLADLNGAVTKAKTERLQKEAVFRQLTSVEKDPAARDTFPAILANQFIQQQRSELASLQRQQTQLAEKLGDRHPDMIKIQSAIQAAQARLQSEISNVVQAVRNEYQAALAQEQGLTAALEQQKGEALSMNRKAIDYSVLDRDVESSRQIYDSLLQRAKETGVSGELKASNIRIVDEAERPRGPVSPRTGLNLMLGLFGGVGLAIGLAFFFEYVDSRIKSPDEVRQFLQIASVGMIPKLGKDWQGNGEPLITADVPPNFAEAFRTVRTNVLFSSASEGARSLVVTSTAPGEGKTMVASNLAIGFAMSGQRVLLVDGDMRRPRVHEVFGQPQEPGLSNLLVGNAKPSECIQKSAVQGLWVLPAGRIPPNPAELLGSKQYKEFIRSVGNQFDCIIVDSPPVMAVSDAVIISNTAGGVIFVVGAEMTSRHAAKAALEQLAQGRAKVVGAVLNRVDLDNHAYYYSQYYRREYAAYYRQAS